MVQGTGSGVLEQVTWFLCELVGGDDYSIYVFPVVVPGSSSMFLFTIGCFILDVELILYSLSRNVLLKFIAQLSNLYQFDFV